MIQLDDLILFIILCFSVVWWINMVLEPQEKEEPKLEIKEKRRNNHKQKYNTELNKKTGHTVRLDSDADYDYVLRDDGEIERVKRKRR